jgi:hypothetical protein
MNDRHTRPAKDDGRIEIYWISLVYEDFNDLSDYGYLLRIGVIWATT